MVKTASLDEFDTARKAGAYVIDVREGDEYAQGHVPGAQLLPLGIVSGSCARSARGRAGLRRVRLRRA